MSRRRCLPVAEDYFLFRGGGVLFGTLTFWSISGLHIWYRITLSSSPSLEYINFTCKIGLHINMSKLVLKEVRKCAGVYKSTVWFHHKIMRFSRSIDDPDIENNIKFLCSERQLILIRNGRDIDMWRPPNMINKEFPSFCRWAGLTGVKRTPKSASGRPADLPLNCTETHMHMAFFCQHNNSVWPW
jgi:hypothetical protein